jgi:hypothetical protein
VAQEGQSDRGVQALPIVARVFDVAQEWPDRYFEAELRGSDPLDSGDQWLTESHGAAGNVPQTRTWPVPALREHDPTPGLNDHLDGQARDLRIDTPELSL